MKRIILYLYLFITFFIVSICPINALASEPDIYYHEESGVSFTVPEGWQQKPLSESKEILQVKFETDVLGEMIGYGYCDVWSELTPSDRIGLSRSDIDNTQLTADDIKYMYEIGEVQELAYNGVSYYQFEYQQATTVDSVTMTVNISVAMHYHNGYMYQFMYYWYMEKTNYEDFEALMKTVTYDDSLQLAVSAGKAALPAVEEYERSSNASAASSSSDSTNGLGLFLSLIITIAVYSLPIIIYRYAIRKKPMAPKQAKRLTIIYAIVGFGGMLFLLYSLGGDPSGGSAVIFWSFVNYKMLIKGYIPQEVKNFDVLKDDDIEKTL